MKKVGLYIGSFNPVHIGHLAIANSIVNETCLDQVWMLVSPMSPHKKNNLAPDYDRFEMLKIALQDCEHIKASDIELNLPKPSYTIQTVRFLKEHYPKYEFSLIIGEDNVKLFPTWKDVNDLISFFKEVYVYPRTTGEKSKVLSEPFKRLNLPYYGISSTQIRQNIEKGNHIDFLVPKNVQEYIFKQLLYQKCI